MSSAPKLPVDEKLIEQFIRIWHSYDPDATYFIPVAKLGDLLDDLRACEESSTLFVHRSDQPFTERYRRRLISLLEVPLFENGRKVMFYDVL